MTDPSVFLLLQQILADTVPGIQIGVYIHLADIVKKIKIKIFYAAFFQLLFKNLLYLIHIGEIVSRKLIGQKKAVSGIAAKGLSQDPL